MHPLRYAVPVCSRLRGYHRRQLLPLIPHRRYDGPIPDRPPIGGLEPNHEVIPDNDDFWQEGMRTIQYAFDPAESVERSQPNLFDFLRPAAKSKRPEWKYANPIHPPALGVPWPTSMTHSFQSKYWDRTEGAVTTFMRDLILKGPWTDDPSRKEYVNHIIDSTVAFVINMFPTSNPGRLDVLAKMYAVLFMHDDLVDLGNALPDGKQLDYGGVRGLGKLGLNRVSSELLGESPLQGKKLLECIQEWESQGQIDPGIFKSFEDYLPHRIQDVGAEAVFRCVEFACDLHLSDHERKSLKLFNAACAEHFVFTNDLYSYAKEVAEAGAGKVPSNAVSVLQGSSAVSPAEAKKMVRESIWDAEQEIYNQYTALLNAHGDGDVRTRYARGAVIALAGNMFYSATCARYARYVEDS